MSTQRIEHTVQGHTYQRPKRTREDVDFSLGPEQSKSRQDDGADSRETARGCILSLLRKVEADTGGELSFADVIAHHEAVQSRWNGEVGDDLAELGVNTDVPFRIMHDPAGGVTVVGEHPGREMIDRYFVANPALVREFGEILQYGRLASAAEARLSPGEMEQTPGVGAMAGWFVTNMDTASLSGEGGIVVGGGGTVYKGLDIRV